MRIYKENIPPKQMMGTSSLYTEQVKRGLLCWNFTSDGEKQELGPTAIWFGNTAYKEPVIISGVEDWVNLWEPIYRKTGRFERQMFERLASHEYDIDKLYYDDEFWEKTRGGITRLMGLLPVSLCTDDLWSIVDDMKRTYRLTLEDDYWYNQRGTIHFWISGLLQYIGSLQIELRKPQIETNTIIRDWIPSLKPYMDNRQFWQDFFKGMEK